MYKFLPSRLLSREFWRNLSFSVLVALFCAHLLVTHDQRYSLAEMLGMGRYYYSLAVNALAALVLIAFVHMVSRRLYRRYVNGGLGKRWISLQLLLGLGLTLVLELLIATGLFYLDGRWIADTVFFKKLFAPISMFVLLVNLFFVVYYLYREPVVRTLVRYRLASPLVGEQLGAERVLGMPALLFVEDRCCWSIGFSGEKLRWPDSLEVSEGRLDENDYFRGQRDWLVHRAAIQRVRQLPGKRLLLVANMVFPVVLEVSRRRAPRFKQWWASAIEG